MKAILLLLMGTIMPGANFRYNIALIAENHYFSKDISMNHTQENQYIGANIRRFRVKRSMSEHELSVAVSKAHRRLTKESLKVLEQGGYRPSPYRVYHIAMALGVALEELLQ